MKNRRRCAELFWAFFRIGLFTFGGGYAMIALIEDEVIRKRAWLDAGELSDVVAIAESTPGPIAINCATYVGYRQAGGWGGVCATLGVVTPSFAIIYLLSRFLETFRQLPCVANAFRGIQVAVAFLVLRAGLRMTVKLPRTAPAWAAWFLAALAIFGINLLGWRFSTIWLIVAGALAGMALYGGGRER